MARNGSGTYNLPAGNPVSDGNVITDTWANSTLSDIATALSNSIAKDGQTSIMGNLPMTTYRHVNVGAASSLTDYARADQVQNSSMQWLTSVAGTDTITAAVGSPTLTALQAGQTFRFLSAGANTTTSVTLNINSIGAKAITKLGATALAIGDIPSGVVVEVTYDGTQFQLNGLAGFATNATNAMNATNATNATTQATNDSSTKIATTAFSNPGALISTNGYHKLPSGLIIQWGSAITGVSSDSTITFPLAFPTACLAVTTSGMVSSTNTAFGVVSMAAITADSFVVGGWLALGSRINYGFRWIAIGY